MVIIDFQVSDKLKKAKFFEEAFLLADNSIEFIFGIPFFTFSKVKVNFIEKEFT